MNLLDAEYHEDYTKEQQNIKNTVFVDLVPMNDIQKVMIYSDK